MKNALDDKLPVALYTAAGVRELDRIAIEERGIAGITLMRRAAAACVAALQRHWPAARRVTVFCGSGNNAGDGYIVAGMLAEKGCDVTVMVVGDPHKLGSDAAEAHRYCLASEARVQPWEVGASIDGDVIVDALLGTGLTGQVRERYLAAVDDIAASARPVLAVDIPSGLSADTGMRLGGAVVADVTVTFIGLKRGLFTLDGPDCAGLVEFAPLDVPSDIYDRVAADSWRLQLPALLAEFPSRPKQAHKNLFGHVLVVGGDEGMGGAALMSAESALRVGAGLRGVKKALDVVGRCHLCEAARRGNGGVAVAGGHVQHGCAGFQVDGLAELFADDLQGGADQGVIAGGPGGLLLGLHGGEIGSNRGLGVHVRFLSAD